MEKINIDYFVKHLPFGFIEEIPDKVGYNVRKQVNNIVNPQVGIIHNFVGESVAFTLKNIFKKWRK